MRRLFRWPFKWFRRRAGRESPTAFEDSQPARAEAAPSAIWKVLGASVQGASHERKNVPNQDALQWWPDSGEGETLILALADGHGSEKCFRSHIGSRLAVTTSIDVLQEFLVNFDQQDMSACKRMVESELPQAIDRAWKRAVERHLEENPLLESEVSALESDTARLAIEQNPTQAYGSTLLALVVHPAFFACLQLGDGDVLAVSQSGVERVLEDDPRLLANETTSLSAAGAWRDFRVRFQTLGDSLPSLILACTDGYSNAFRTDEGFLSVGSDLARMLGDPGIEYVEEHLPHWLEEASQQGSGDDVTAAMLFCLASLPSPHTVDGGARHEQVDDGTSNGTVAAPSSADPREA
ncbi:MAG: PP2C family serine/threonine-protein phosphatase [Pirellulaceae bacterium]